MRYIMSSLRLTSPGWPPAINDSAKCAYCCSHFYLNLSVMWGNIYVPFWAVCLNHFLCLFHWPGGYLIRVDTRIHCWSSPQATVDGATSSIPVKAVNCCCFISFVPLFLQQHQRGELTDGASTLTEVPFILQVRIICYWQSPTEPCQSCREEGSHCCLFPRRHYFSKH